jgi:hypothetical protein
MFPTSPELFFQLHSARAAELHESVRRHFLASHVILDPSANTRSPFSRFAAAIGRLPSVVTLSASTRRPGSEGT